MDHRAPDRPYDGLAENVATALERARVGRRPGLVSEIVGEVTSIGNGVARVSGLSDVSSGELVAFSGGARGIATDLERDGAGVILLGDVAGIAVGEAVRRTRRVADVPVGPRLLGRVIDPLGRPLDSRGPLRTRDRSPVDRAAPAIIDRAPVAVPLQTGIKAIDAAIPIGRGQRELILGDRQTGKTAIATAAIANQRDSGVISVYCAVGQRGSAVRQVIARLESAGALANTVVVVASGNDAPGLQFIAPYAATSIAESFMARGYDALVVYDDLTRHARTYRELSLLLRRPPGREAYPGDIFYIHSRLLERSTRLKQDKGGGSLTALPIIETQAQNIAAFIPTNLISITDGQIYLSPVLFRKGHLPAIDIGRSVSRVGGQAQLPAFRAVTGDLKLAYSQFEELEIFARFGTRLDEETRRRLERGRRVREALRQRESERVPVPEQIAIFIAAVHGLFDLVALDRMRLALDTVAGAVPGHLPQISESIVAGRPLAEEDRQAIIEAARRALHHAELI